MARHGSRGRGRNADGQGGIPINAPPASVLSTTSGDISINALRVSASSNTSSGRSTPSASNDSSSDRGGGFFAQYPDFQEDPDAKFLTNFKRLKIAQGWTNEEAKVRRHEGLETEWDSYMGADVTKLEGWQRMCKDCAIEPVPSSITKCKKALAQVHVNIYNFLDHLRNPERFPLRLFPNVKKLRKYSLNGRIYSLERAKEGTFLKALLRPFFSKRNQGV